MNKSSNILKILAHFEKTEDDLAEDVIRIKEWLKSQRHLPETPSDRMIEFFIINNKFRLEKTKTKLDNYYTIRSQIPSVFSISNPSSPQMKGISDTMYAFTLPKLIDDLYQVTIFKEKDYLPDDFDLYHWIALLPNGAEVRFHEDFILGAIIILDHQHLKMGHILKVTPMHIKNTLAIMEKVLSDRIKEWHFINIPPVFDVLWNLVKPFVPPKILARLHLHKSPNELVKYIPLDILPKDYGGNEKSIDELQADWNTKLASYQDRFDKLDTLKVNESLRLTPRDDIHAFGVQGTFRKINVD